jgi:nicotinamide mononucleotide transporter
LLDALLNNWLEWIGLVSGVLCVWLLIRQNILTFPIGLAYAVVTVIVVGRADLYADVLLNLYYVVMNAYGWYFWAYGGKERRQENTLAIAFTPRRTLTILAAILVVGTLVMGYVFRQVGADLAYPDSLTTVGSFIAMWMTARKYIDNWLWWFVIDVIQIGLYLIKGIEAYALLYLIYLGMAVMGWLAWKKHLEPQAT